MKQMQSIRGEKCIHDNVCNEVIDLSLFSKRGLERIHMKCAQ
jgi:hypothetical protein